MTDGRILVVDDEPDLRWVLRGLFEDAGFEVVEAGDGRQALERVAEQPPDVVLSAADGWTARTRDGSRSAHFEVCVAITENGFEVLTRDIPKRPADVEAAVSG